MPICPPCAAAAAEGLIDGIHYHDPAFCTNPTTCPCQHGGIDPRRISPEAADAQ